MEVKIGFIVNPYAGIGGPLGMKGSDGEWIRDLSSQKGVERICLKKARQFLRDLSQAFLPKQRAFSFLTCDGEMGAHLLDEAGFRNYTLCYRTKTPHSTFEDTQRAAQAMIQEGVSCLVFAGGDGTARNIYTAVGQNLPIIAIPGGVKMHSAVFAQTPMAAANMLEQFLRSEVKDFDLADVMDIDEEAFRCGRVSARLFGYFRTPITRTPRQGAKVAGWSDEQGDISEASTEIIESMQKDTLYLIGPGSTTSKIIDSLDGENSLLGVDVLCNKKIIAKDANSEQLLNLTQNRPFYIVLTPIGGQGCLLGRGNTQLTPNLIRRCGRDSIIVIASAHKLASIERGTFYNDTGDNELDRQLAGYYRVITGKDRYVMYRCL